MTRDETLLQSTKEQRSLQRHSCKSASTDVPAGTPAIGPHVHTHTEMTMPHTTTRQHKDLPLCLKASSAVVEHARALVVYKHNTHTLHTHTAASLTRTAASPSPLFFRLAFSPLHVQMYTFPHLLWLPLSLLPPTLCGHSGGCDGRRRHHPPDPLAALHHWVIICCVALAQLPHSRNRPPAVSALVESCHDDALVAGPDV